MRHLILSLTSWFLVVTVLFYPITPVLAELSVPVAIEDALLGLADFLGPDRELSFVSWKPIDFQKAVETGFTTVWLGIGSFVRLSPQKQQAVLDSANAAGLRTLGFIGGDPNWVHPARPGQFDFVEREYRGLSAILLDRELGELKIAFATDIEPYTRHWWDGDLALYSDLLEQVVVPAVEAFAEARPDNTVPLLTRFEPFWLENGHVSSGRTLRGLRDFPSIISSMTYRDTSEQLDRVSEAVRRRADEAQGVTFNLGVETKPPSRGIPPHITFHGELEAMAGALIDAAEMFSEGAWTDLNGVFVHTGKAEADETLDALWNARLKLSSVTPPPAVPRRLSKAKTSKVRISKVKVHITWRRS